MRPDPQQPVHVAVGVVKNSAGELLISRRKLSAHQGGLWEFPGGKVEPGETVEQALARELKEELDIAVSAAAPLIKINYNYPDRRVLLDVWSVENFSGAVRACEGQPFKWVAADALPSHRFPAANQPIMTAASLPHRYAIVEGNDVEQLLRYLQQILVKDIKLIQLRQKSLPASDIERFLDTARRLCRKSGASLLLNSGVADAFHLMADGDGLHLTSDDLMSLTRRPVGLKWLAASCHTLAQLVRAERLGVDFAVLAPVKPTSTHPGVMGLGWQKFAEMIDNINMPVFALGGMQAADEVQCRRMGGQGIAGISLFRD